MKNSFWYLLAAAKAIVDWTHQFRQKYFFPSLHFFVDQFDQPSKFRWFNQAWNVVVSTAMLRFAFNNTTCYLVGLVNGTWTVANWAEGGYSFLAVKTILTSVKFWFPFVKIHTHFFEIDGRNHFIVTSFVVVVAYAVEYSVAAAFAEYTAFWFEADPTYFFIFVPEIGWEVDLERGFSCLFVFFLWFASQVLFISVL